MPVYGLFQYNTNLYNGGPSNVPLFSTDLVVFDGFSLSDNVNTFTQELVESEPTRDIIGGPVPRDDGMYTIADYYREKELLVSGIIKQSTKEDLDAYLDTVRAALRGREMNLDITRTDSNGDVTTVRRYIATLKNPESLFADRRGWNITICPFKAVFTCRTPFGQDRTYTSFEDTLTSSPSTLTPVTTGTYKCKPVIVLLFNSAASVTLINVNNTATEEQIAYTGSASANDWFIFDSAEKTVTKNGTAVDYTGLFPSLDVGSNPIIFTIDGMFNLNCTIRWKNTFL